MHGVPEPQRAARVSLALNALKEGKLRMRNQLFVYVAVALIAGGGFALAQGVSQSTTGSQATDQKSAAPKNGAAKQAQTPAQDKAKASSASQPRDEKGRFTKKSSEQSGSSAAAPNAKGASSAGQPRDEKGRFTKKADPSGSSAAASNAKSTTGLGNSQGDQAKSASAGSKSSKTKPSWVSKAMKTGGAAAGRPAMQMPTN